MNNFSSFSVYRVTQKVRPFYFIDDVFKNPIDLYICTILALIEKNK